MQAFLPSLPPSLRFVVFACTPSSHPRPTLPCRDGALQLSGGALPNGGEGGETCRFMGVQERRRSSRHALDRGQAWLSGRQQPRSPSHCLRHRLPNASAASLHPHHLTTPTPPPSVSLKAPLPPTLLLIRLWVNCCVSPGWSRNAVATATVALSAG